MGNIFTRAIPIPPAKESIPGMENTFIRATALLQVNASILLTDDIFIREIAHPRVK
jgi:hypothetical protein